MDFRCSCGAVLKVKESHIGKKARCPRCNTIQVISSGGATETKTFGLVEEEDSGAPLPSACAGCGTVLESANRVCPECGYDPETGKKPKRKKKRKDKQFEEDLQDPIIASLLAGAEAEADQDEDKDFSDVSAGPRRRRRSNGGSLKAVGIGLYFHLGSAMLQVLALVLLWIGIGGWLLGQVLREPKYLSVTELTFVGAPFILGLAGLLNLPGLGLCMTTPDRKGRIYLIISLLIWVGAFAAGGGTGLMGEAELSSLIMIGLALASTLFWLLFLRSLSDYVGSAVTTEEFSLLTTGVAVALVVCLTVVGLPYIIPLVKTIVNAIVESGYFCVAWMFIGLLVVPGFLMLAGVVMMVIYSVPISMRYVRTVMNLVAAVQQAS